MKESSEHLWCEYSSDADCKVCRRRIDVMYGLNRNRIENSLKTKQAQQMETNADIIETDDSHQKEIPQYHNNKSVLVDSSTSPFKMSEVQKSKCVIKTSVGFSTSNPH